MLTSRSSSLILLAPLRPFFIALKFLVTLVCMAMILPTKLVKGASYLPLFKGHPNLIPRHP